MIRFVFALCFSLFFCSCIQDNSDLFVGNRYKAISWEGLTDKFIIEDNSDFRLNDDKKEGCAYLYATSTRVRETVWRFTVDFSFNPSSKSFVRSYLSASTNGFMDNTDGYFIQLGSTTDDVVLYRQDGEVYKRLITGRKKLLDQSNFSLSVKVICDTNGRWTLYSYLPGVDSGWYEEGISIDETYTASRYQGFYMEYSPSYSSKLFISNVSVKDLADDEDDDLGDTEPDVPSVSASFGDVVFSEIMANPSGSASLPEVEYIELYNRTENMVSLNGWTLFYDTKAYSLGEAMLSAHGFMVLYNEKYSSQLVNWRIPMLPLKSFPILANTGKLLYLEDAGKQLVSWVEYSEAWYKDDFKKKGGFSLESIDMDNLSGSADNWKGSADKRGGTPGEYSSVKSINPDNELPYVSDCYLSAPDTLVVNFTKPMRLASIASLDNYELLSLSGLSDRALPDYPCGRNVRIALQKPLKDGELVQYKLNGLKDVSGLDLVGELTVQSGMNEEVETGDVLFNELLFNPCSNGVDYVELYNNTDKYIALNRLYFSTRKDDSSFSDGVALSKLPQTFPPHSYLCFTSDANAVSRQYRCEKTYLREIVQFPGLPDDKGNLVLLNSAGEVLDEFAYSAKMHTALLKDSEGFALEKRSPELSSSLSSHWLSASTSSGGGTPGYRNSQFRKPGVVTKEGFWLDNKSFSPNNDGDFDELLIAYALSEENYVADVRVCDANGRTVCTIADNDVLASQGFFVWTGKGDDGHLCRMGMYVIYIEAYNPLGEVKRYKLSCSLSR